jgi:hypothetical protein
MEREPFKVCTVFNELCLTFVKSFKKLDKERRDCSCGQAQDSSSGGLPVEVLIFVSGSDGPLEKKKLH